MDLRKTNNKNIQRRGNNSRNCDITHNSFRDIGKVIRKSNGEKDSKVMSNRSKAYKMFYTSKPIIEVAISLDLDYEEIKQYYFEYLSLKGMTNFVKFLEDHDYYLHPLSLLAEKIKSHEFDESDVNVMISNVRDIKTLTNKKGKLQHEINMLIIERGDHLSFGHSE